MKKLMIAAAIVCVAVVSQAAKVDWSASAVYDPWTTASSGKNTAANGWLGYAILAADYGTVTADLAKGDTSSLLSAAVGPSGKKAVNGKFTETGASGNVAGGDQNFYLIVLNSGNVADATYFYASAVTPMTVDASLDTVISFGSQATGSKPTSGWTAMAVPEPTSGLLLLLGVAGLALKRRRA